MASPEAPPEAQQHHRGSDDQISRVSSQSSARSSQSVPAKEGDTGELDAVKQFKELTNQELTEKVEEFAKAPGRGLAEHSELLIYGAELAKDVENALADYPKSSSLSKEQKEYLEGGEKTTGFVGQSKYLKGSLLSTCLAGIIQGWTQSAMNGANLGITDQFNIDYRPEDIIKNTGDLWVFGIINAVPFLVGGFLAPFVSDPLQEHYLGRRGALAVACVLSIAATIGQSFAKTIGQIIGCRVITGLTLAAKASTAPLLTAEVAPDHLRGNLLSTWQLSDAFGIFLGFSANLAVQHMKASTHIQWRVMIALSLIPTVILLFLVYFMPESPRFLMKQGKHPKALESFTLLRPSPVSRLLAARDYIYAHFQLEVECESMDKRKEARKSGIKEENSKGLAEDNRKGDVKVTEAETKKRTKNEQGQRDLEAQGAGSAGITLYDISRTNYFQRLDQTFRDGRSRRALVCASTAMISQQLTGINTITFLSATLIRTIHGSDRTGAWVGFGLGLCNFIFGLPAFWLLDRIGRATMLLLGFVPLFVLMLVLAFSFKDGTDGNAHVPLVGTFGLLFFIAYSPTAGTSPFAISAEVFPLVVREVGHSLAVAVNFIGLGVVLLVFPSLSDGMGGYKGSLSLFAGLNLVAFVLCFLFVPETKGRTLEELSSIFDIPTRYHITYRVKVVAPWLAKRYLRSWAVRLHLWRKPKSTVIDPPEFHDWYMGILQRLNQRRTEPKQLEKQQ